MLKIKDWGIYQEYLFNKVFFQFNWRKTEGISFPENHDQEDYRDLSADYVYLIICCDNYM